MKVVVIGCGHVGLVTAIGLAEFGHTVIGVDSDPDKVATLQAGRSHFYEPGLDDLLTHHHKGRITFTDDPAQAVEGADIAFICVNTPPRPETGHLNLVYVEQAARTIAAHAQGHMVIVEKSTCPVQTARRIIDVLKQADRYPDIEVVCNPEFLREGHAIHDTLHPDRIVIGYERQGRAQDAMHTLYRPLLDQQVPLIETNLETAEVIKHASNSYLALKISYINAVAGLCETVGADIDQVALGMGTDPRIGPHFLQAGVGYGGSCFPKDVAAFAAQAHDSGHPIPLLDQIRHINDHQRTRLIDKTRKALWNIDGKHIAIWGLAFKPGTDDLREAPSLSIIPTLQAEGATIHAHDPAAATKAAHALPDLHIHPGPLDAAKDADALIVLTDWPEYANITPTKLKETLKQPIVIDGRNIWPWQTMADHGFTYLSFGRPDIITGEIRRPRR